MSKRKRAVVNATPIRAVVSATPIYDDLKKKTDIAYDTPNNVHNIRNLIEAIKELNTEDLYHEIENNEEKNEEFMDLFCKLQTGDIVRLDIKPSSCVCKYGENCYRINFTHKLNCHDNRDHWTRPFLEILEPSNSSKRSKTAGRKTRKSRKVRKSRKTRKSRKKRKSRK